MIENIHISQIRREPSSQTIGILRNSVRARGIVNPITVHLVDGVYHIIDGKLRVQAAWEAGLEEIPCIVVELDAAIKLLEIQPSAQKVPIKPIEYARQLKKMLNHNPTLDIASLARKLGKSSGWIAKTLRLNNIMVGAGIITMINDGTIRLLNAYALAKLPMREQIDWVDRAKLLDPTPFLRLVNTRRRELREAAKKPKATHYNLTLIRDIKRRIAASVPLVKEPSATIYIKREPSSPPPGWDTVDGRRYCLGGMLIEPVTDGWKLWHPDLPEICCMIFIDANTAATFVEKHFKEYV